ncbi:ABC transporter ATP-binding protein [Sporanaerobacter acetigenes]|uniref:ABC-type multidrug transport system, ATPase and permease component n=1 Tax=Sporanaerobacter acetigenes DSM 13106 TaxID=1123281 RepID=A0A1M5XAG9_9FIRM|nr:ABC transporter ATP-binding protein [Sporanaerobacter acetigenes]SHH96719.1 ABC-type multidrug transport system, ATPase and permease component [Sporanaerobacter acetigenes DSM 13106]
MKSLLMNNKKELFLHIIICFIAASIQVATALIYKVIIDTALSGNLKKLVWVSIFSILYLILDMLFDYFPRVTKAKLVHCVMHDIRSKLVDKISDMDSFSIENADKSKIISKLVNDANIVENEYLKPLAGLILSLFIFVLSIFLSFQLEAKFAILMIILSAAPLLSPYISKKILKDKRNLVSQEQDNYFSLFQEFVSFINTLKIGNSIPNYSKNLSEKSEDLKKKKIDFESFQGLTYAVSFFLGGIAYSGTWIIGGFFVALKKITVGDLIAMTTLMSTISGPLQYLSSTFTELVSSKKITDELCDYINETHNIDTNCNKIALKDPIKFIRLSNISFSYNDKPIFCNFSHVFERGKKYAIVGESGSGKSTLLNIILGLCEVDEGKVNVNEINLKDIDFTSYYDKISLVKQKPDIFTATISENVALFHSYNDEEIKNSLIKSGLKKLITTHSINKVIGNNSCITLSGGEEKRLEVSRSILKNSQAVLFDEPTSGLDAENENNIGNLIKQLSDKIVIVVTHTTNKSFLDNFDEIIKIESKI